MINLSRSNIQRLQKNGARGWRCLLLAIFIATGNGSQADAAVALDALGQLLTSRGYCGAQLVHPDNYYRLPINSSGHAGHLVIDTGAPTTLFYRQSLKAFGLTEAATKERVEGAFGSGRELFGLTRLPSLAIGNCSLVNVPSVVASDRSSGLYRRYGSADGLFGLREMAKYGAILDLGHRLIYLNPAGRSKTVSPNVNGLLTAAGYTPIQLTISKGHLHVPGAINGAQCTFVVDTGASLTVLDRPLARAAKIGGYRTLIAAEGLGKSGGEISAAKFPSMRVGTFEIKNASAVIVDLNPNMVEQVQGSQGMGLLGAEYLAKNSAIFDFNSGQLYLREKPSKP
jgi:predicted aspartyl protease